MSKEDITIRELAKRYFENGALIPIYWNYDEQEDEILFDKEFMVDEFMLKLQEIEEVINKINKEEIK